MKKIALITGTSSGIGLHSAVLLAKAGYTVIATMRNLDKASALQREADLQKVSVELRQLDVQDQTSVDRCVQEIMHAHGQIDLLVNNAGSGYLGSMEETSMQDLQQIMDVNFFGVWRVTQAVFPLMRAASSGRIISLSSVGGLLGQPFNDGYCAAKFALEGFMESLAPVAQRFGIQLSLIEPGPVNTEFVSAVQEKIRNQTNSAYDAMRTAYLAGAAQAYASLAQSGIDVAEIIVNAASAETPHFRYATSDMIRSVIAKKYVDPTGETVLALSGARLP